MTGSSNPQNDQVDADDWSLWWVRMSAPENEAPIGITPFGVLGRSDSALVAITASLVYSTGIGMILSVRLRKQLRGLSSRMFDLIGGNTTHGEEAAAHERLWLGVEYPDGRTAVNQADNWPQSLTEDRVVLTNGGGHGGTFSYDVQYWLAPLPPPGPLTFICTWPVVNIPETRTVVDGDEIARAATRTEILWPKQSEDEDGRRSPPEPPAGWFSETINDR